jgi:hypothetical protein
MIGHAHHNIAWQLTRDRRFVSSVGTISDLAREAAEFDGDVMLSSEDFEALLDEPGRFDPLRLHPALREREFTLLIYLRNQSSYLESLFLELLDHGIGDEFMLLAQSLLRDRRIQVREWTFQFDYARIYAGWMACGWANTIVRNYHQLAGGSTITDFCGIVCPGVPAEAMGAALRLNPRRPLRDSLFRFYANRLQRPLEQREEQAIEQICNTLNGRPVTLSNELRQAFDKTFGKANRTLCSAAGLPATGLAQADHAPACAAPLERVFSFELHNMIADNTYDPDIKALLDSPHGMLPGVKGLSGLVSRKLALCRYL